MSQVMRDLAILFIHLVVTLARLLRPGGTRAVVAESLLVKHQLVILTRSRRRAPPLKPSDRVIAGLCALPMRPADAPGPDTPVRHRPETRDNFVVPPSAREAKVSPAVFLKTARQARA
jgi:hypothetical protein